MMICQDRLGTNVGGIQNERETVLSQALAYCGCHAIANCVAVCGVPLLCYHYYWVHTLWLGLLLCSAANAGERRENGSFEPFMHKCDLFTKTGSGQT